MKIYVCVTYYDGGESEINGTCSSREVAEKFIAEYAFGAEIEEFELWTDEDFEEGT